jgi:uncharacterized protein YijF (DUF1287 family)
VLKKISSLAVLLVIAMSLVACSSNRPTESAKKTTIKPSGKKAIVKKTKTTEKFIPVIYEKRSPRKRHASQRRGNSANSPFLNKLSNAAIGRLRSRVRYDGSYVKIGYPWGDVPPNIGVCTDVVIRSYRKLGVDLQQQVHQDMSAAFNAYPNLNKWNLSRPDTNIDHRRVVNLRKFFARRGASLPLTRNPADYKPGDLVTWIVGPSLTHIGIVVDKPTRADPRRKMIVHNIGSGPQMEDILFRFRMTGHYRYTPRNMKNIPPPSVYVSNTHRKASQKRSHRGQMSYAQLLAASNRLGTSPQKRTATAKKPASIQLAKRSEEAAMRQLLAK